LRELPGGPATIDEQVLSGDIAAGIAAEEDEGSLEFFRPAHASHGGFFAEAFDHLGRGLFRGEWARAEAIDADAVAGPIDGEMAGHVDDAPLEGVVADGAGGADPGISVGIAADDAVHGAQHDNGPGGLPGDDMISKQAGEDEVPGGIGELAGELFGGDRGEVGTDRLVAIVDEHIDLPGAGDRLGEPGGAVVGALVIEFDSEVVLAGAAGEAAGRFASAVGVAAGDDDLGTGFRQGSAERGSQVA